MSAMFEVLSYVRTRKGGLRPDIPMTLGCRESALRAAMRLRATKDLVLAVTHDEERGSVVLLAYGDVPEELLDQ